MSNRAHAVVRRIWDETPRLKGVLLEVEEAVARQYQRPGQIVVVHPNATEQVYLAISSPPGEARGLELLVGPQAAAKLALAEGVTLELDPPTGRGFPVELAQGQDVLLFAVGSALAPMRPRVESIRRARAQYGRVTLFMGAHSEEDFPYAREYEDWHRDQIEVVRAISRPWVQELFRARAVSVENAVAFVAGMKGMMEGVTEALIAAGMPKERIGKNW